jgi:hypothetical protein
MINIHNNKDKNNDNVSEHALGMNQERCSSISELKIILKACRQLLAQNGESCKKSAGLDSATLNHKDPKLYGTLMLLEMYQSPSLSCMQLRMGCNFAIPVYQV